MKALRGCAAVLALSVSFVLVGCANDDTTDGQVADQTGASTGATTFSASVSNGTGNPIGDRHAAALHQSPIKTVAAVEDPNGNP